MQVNWRSLLSDIRVAWIDKGRNVSRGNVNIACPWCQNDPSQHLGISLVKEAYYCYREPNRHSGRSFISLLFKLGQGRIEAVRLLKRYTIAGASLEFAQPIAVKRDIIQTLWDRFSPAQYNDACLHYLHTRGFRSPKIVCEQYGLRFAREGRYANRLLIPFSLNGQIKSFTGRALYNSMELRYLAYDRSASQYLYSPNASKPHADTLALVEGPVDALKLAYAGHRLPIIVAALNGKQLGSDKYLQLRNIASKVRLVLVALDADVSMSYAYDIINNVAQVLRPHKIARAKLPIGYKDPGELPTEEALRWLNAQRSAQN